eukprot:353839-Chlamydomonas_euryale.AAC.49
MLVPSLSAAPVLEVPSVPVGLSVIYASGCPQTEAGQPGLRVLPGIAVVDSNGAKNAGSGNFGRWYLSGGLPRGGGLSTDTSLYMLEPPVPQQLAPLGQTEAFL